MTTAWAPPRRGYHLRVFVVSLLLVVAALVLFLFGVRMEATVPATGVVRAREQQEVRAPLAGLIEVGWQEGELTRAGGRPLQVRLDDRGNGTTEPAGEGGLAVRAWKLSDGRTVPRDALRWHKIQAGDEVWPGQVLAHVRDDDSEQRLKVIEGRVQDLEAQQKPAHEARAQRDALRTLLARATLRAPSKHALWSVLKVHVESGAAVRPGESVALLAPLDPATRQPLDLTVQLEVSDRHRADLEPGQLVRLYPAMYNQRLHGHADAAIERIEPWGEPGPGGERCFTVLARVAHAPFTLRPGAACRAEIVLGRKQVYRLILEQ
ncbi:MAG: hypothetical protein L0Z62_09150 [Gemmataceae bacterium]|nr:hypothetical protein [Gemmataceae bacterium]